MTKTPAHSITSARTAPIPPGSQGAPRDAGLLLTTTCPLMSRQVRLSLGRDPRSLASLWRLPACGYCRDREQACANVQPAGFNVRDAYVASVLLAMAPGQA